MAFEKATHAIQCVHAAGNPIDWSRQVGRGLSGIGDPQRPRIIFGEVRQVGILARQAR